jgi:hypothetical protein
MEWPMKKYNFDACQDWHSYFSKLFSITKINSLLEFGLGNGTELLLDNCQQVHSVELSVGSLNKDWYGKCVKKYESYNNWFPTYIDVPPAIVASNELAQSHRYPLPNNDHLPVLKSLVLPFLKKKHDFIFVDAGIHNRGDLVNMSFGYAPIIAAHDTCKDPNRILKDIYGYNIVQVPSDYEVVHFEDTYMGTTFWILKSRKNLIDEMKSFKQ